MSVWRYTAITFRTPHPERRSGETTGESAAEIRASLRRIGLQVIDLRPIRSRRKPSAAQGGSAAASAVDSPGRAWSWRPAWDSVAVPVVALFHRYLRGRRRDERAELYDSLGTMLSAGVPLLEAVDTVIGSTRRRRSSQRWMLIQVRQQLRSGSSLGQAMTEHPSWFDASEVAMVRAGQHSGTLPDVLRSLSERHERSGELSHRLIGALAYPAIVATVGLGVAVFLSVKTLPSLAAVLNDAGLAVPALTRNVMAFGQLLADHWLAIGFGLLLIGAAISIGAGLLARWEVQLPASLQGLHPKLLRRIAVARLALHLAELLRSGVPVVDALRVLAPTNSGGLRRQLLSAADEVERGAELSTALNNEHWFDAEFRRLLDIGQASGELEALLERIGHRYARQGSRLIDRLTTLLEPCVILTLAVLVGIVVMAAILPLIRLQEIL